MLKEEARKRQEGSVRKGRFKSTYPFYPHHPNKGYAASTRERGKRSLEIPLCVEFSQVLTLVSLEKESTMLPSTFFSFLRKLASICEFFFCLLNLHKQTKKGFLWTLRTHKKSPSSIVSSSSYHWRYPSLAELFLSFLFLPSSYSSLLSHFWKNRDKCLSVFSTSNVLMVSIRRRLTTSFLFYEGNIFICSLCWWSGLWFSFFCRWSWWSTWGSCDLLYIYAHTRQGKTRQSKSLVSNLIHSINRRGRHCLGLS